MSTSKPQQPPGAPPAPNSYTRFIPREELGNFAAWSPEAFEPPPAGAPADVGLRKPTLAERAAAEVHNRKANAQQAAEIGKALREAASTLRATPVGSPTQSPPAAKPAARPAPASGAATASATSPQAAAAKPAPKPTARRSVIGGVPGEDAAQQEAQSAPAEPEGITQAQLDEAVREARQTAYQEGYRNGLAALESYKQTQSAQMSTYMSDQIGMLASDFHQRLESLEQQLAGRIAGVALELARQVVRADLAEQPETVVQVAEEALNTLLTSARHVVLRLNPEDHALAQAQLAEVLTARGVRIQVDAGITRGGCLIESDIAVVDASVEARWERAAAALGHRAPWNGGREALEDTSLTTAAERMEAVADAAADLHREEQQALAPEDRT
jgi:flagellar assembly protein FliH